MKLELITPNHKQELLITYGFAVTPFGLCLIALIQESVCHLSFWDQNAQEQAIEGLFQEWRNAQFVQDTLKIEQIAQRIFSSEIGKEVSLSLVLRGTPFQIKVWNALLAIPCGQTVSYQSVAQAIGQPTATRAAASAIAKNNISYLIPCHRVIAKSGKIHNYRWGAERKKTMLEFEEVIVKKYKAVEIR